MKSSDFQESDLEVLKEYHQFIRDDEFDENNKDDWKVRLARRYYDQLYKEYALTDLSHYEAGIIGMRWRTEQEIMNGKGQDFCGAIGCSLVDDLRNFEVPFSYEEDAITKAELVKVCLCKKCAKKLKFYQEKTSSASVLDTTEENETDKQAKKKTKH
jgi:hypothetical protein